MSLFSSVIYVMTVEKVNYFDVETS